MEFSAVLLYRAVNVLLQLGLIEPNLRREIVVDGNVDFTDARQKKRQLLTRLKDHFGSCATAAVTATEIRFFGFVSNHLVSRNNLSI